MCPDQCSDAQPRDDQDLIRTYSTVPEKPFRTKNKKDIHSTIQICTTSKSLQVPPSPCLIYVPLRKLYDSYIVLAPPIQDPRIPSPSIITSSMPSFPLSTPPRFSPSRSLRGAHYLSLTCRSFSTIPRLGPQNSGSAVTRMRADWLSARIPAVWS